MIPDLDADALGEMKALDEARTKGEWSFGRAATIQCGAWEVDFDGSCSYRHIATGDDEVPVAIVTSYYNDDERLDANTQFICALANHATALLSLAESALKAKEESARLREALENIASQLWEQDAETDRSGTWKVTFCGRCEQGHGTADACHWTDIPHAEDCIYASALTALSTNGGID